MLKNYDQAQECSLSEKVETPIDQASRDRYQGNQIFRRNPLFKDRSDKNHKHKMVKSRIKNNLLIAKGKVVACKKTRKQGMCKYGELTSFSNSMPKAPHNTTQYITQTAHPNSYFSLEQAPLADSFATEDIIENHSMLGSMRDMLIGNNSFFQNGQQVGTIQDEEAKSKDQHIIHLEDSKQGAKPKEKLAYTTPIYLSDLFKKARSSPNKTEEVIQYLVSQVKVRNDLIYQMEIKQQT